ncbi:hypothetical protein GCM10011343_04830 [Flavobacterium orientale]|uniref:Uncharacterized protein n=1 Tax=Flavobacterium orientale TaxID=1756020 RepID=A0A917D974_9FLAO|nr:hypothetical protein GCM10011343_04830 [Flavobacterium orientale]
MVGHGEVYGGKVTLYEGDVAEGDIIDFGFLEIAIVEGAFHEHHSRKVTVGEVAVFEGAQFKFFIA